MREKMSIIHVAVKKIMFPRLCLNSISIDFRGNGCIQSVQIDSIRPKQKVLSNYAILINYMYAIAYDNSFI